MDDIIRASRAHLKRGGTLDLSMKKLTGILDLSGYTHVRRIDISFNSLTEVILPPGLLELICHHNQLIKLLLPPGLKKVCASHNKLIDLTLPPGVIEAIVSNNELTRLKVSNSVEILFCEH